LHCWRFAGIWVDSSCPQVDLRSLRSAPQLYITRYVTRYEINSRFEFPFLSFICSSSCLNSYSTGRIDVTALPCRRSAWALRLSESITENPREFVECGPCDRGIQPPLREAEACLPSYSGYMCVVAGIIYQRRVDAAVPRCSDTLAIRSREFDGDRGFFITSGRFERTV
jgi:hypothetical protein